MKVSVRVFKGKNNRGITVKKLGKSHQSHKAGTVVMRGVKFGKSVLGDMIEETERVYLPKAKSEVNFTPDGDVRIVQAVSSWERAVYIGNLGGYYNPRTGRKVTEAAFVYMAGDQIYYTN